MIDEGTVTLTKSEYASLKRDADFFQALDTVGVDGWEGFAEAKQLLWQWQQQEEAEADVPAR